MTLPAEAFVAHMRAWAGWVDSGHLDRCDRCGARFPEPSYVDWDIPVLLTLCPVCQRLVYTEVYTQRRPVLMAIYHGALAAARRARRAGIAPEVSGVAGAEPV